jgi:hypothetical protein
MESIPRWASNCDSNSPAGPAPTIATLVRIHASLRTSAPDVATASSAARAGTRADFH